MGNLSTILKDIGAGEFGLLEFLTSIIFSLACGVIALVLYRVYFTEVHDRNESLTRSFIVIAPSITAIFWAIQYSLPLSLGLLGALSFVRFRTPIKKPEDIAFILLVIALALLSSVFRFFAAGILLGVIMLVVLAKTLVTNGNIPFFGRTKGLTAFVSTSAEKLESMDSTIRNALRREFSELGDRGLVLNDVVQKDRGYNLRYSIYLKNPNGDCIPRIFDTLKGLEGLERVEVFHGRTE